MQRKQSDSLISSGMDRWAEGTSLRAGNALAQKCQYYSTNAAQRTARSPEGKQDLK